VACRKSKVSTTREKTTERWRKMGGKRDEPTTSFVTPLAVPATNPFKSTELSLFFPSLFTALSAGADSLRRPSPAADAVGAEGVKSLGEVIGAGTLVGAVVEGDIGGEEGQTKVERRIEGFDGSRKDGGA
jgi:hypothetical protein